MTQSFLKSKWGTVGLLAIVILLIVMALVGYGYWKYIEERHTQAFGPLTECNAEDVVDSLDEALARPTTCLLRIYDDPTLTSLPSDIKDLKNVWQMQILRTSLEELPAEIGQMKSLQVLWLDDNNLKSLPVELGKLPRLKTLIVANNQLTDIPDELSELANLSELYLDGNPISSLNKERIKQLLPEATVWFDEDVAQPAVIESPQPQPLPVLE